MNDTTSNASWNRSGIILYRTEDGANRIQVRLDGESVWLTQAGIAELYQTSIPNISMHIRNILREEELLRDSVVKFHLTTASDGKKYNTRFFNLDMILAVGYRVRSTRGVQFRQWATEHLREYLVKGFTMDDERLKGANGPADYFDELLSRIREIRASEARVYKRIKEIFALASDYLEGTQETQAFYAAMQNKMHYAATGMTAPEIICNRANAGNPNMGLTSWKGGRVLKRDVSIAKNYLDEKEIDTLNRIVVMFLDQAEFRAQRRRDIKMRDWDFFLNKFLRDAELPVLENSGSVTHDEASTWACEQYDAFSERRRLEAEAVAEGRYLDDLWDSARIVEADRKKTGEQKIGREAEEC